jgi:hypothetical protein
MQEKMQEAQEMILSSQEKVNEAYDRYISYVEQANAIKEHEVALTELIYGDKAFRKMGAYYEAEIKNNKLSSDALAQKYASNKQAYEEALAAGNLDSETMNQITDAYL